MIITCIEDYKEYLKKDKDYLVIEVYISLRKQSISYRTVDEDGVLAIYDSDLFTIKNPTLNSYSIKVRDLDVQIMLNALLELDKVSINIEGIWGEYFDKEEKVIINIHQIVKEHARVEGVVIPEPTAY